METFGLFFQQLHHFSKRYSTQTNRFVVVFGVLILSAFLPILRLSISQQTIILGLFLGTGILLLFLHRPPLGIVGLIIATLTIPFSIGTGTLTRINIAVLLLALLIGLWFFDMIVRQRRIYFVKSNPVLPVIIFVLISILSFGFGQFKWFSTPSASISAQVGGLMVILLSIGAFLLVANQVHDIHWLKLLTWIFLILGGVYIILRIFPEVVSITNRIFQRGADGSLFWVWFIALAISQALLNRCLARGWRLILCIFVLGAFYANFNWGTWVSGWLPPLVAVIAIFLIYKPRYSILFVILAAVLASLNIKGIVEFILIGDNQYSLITRIESWRIVAEIIKVNPIFGLGPANYHWYASLFPIMGYYVPFNSHNNYVDIIAQVGLLGLACFLWLLWVIGRLGWQLRDKVPEGFARAYVYGALGGLAGMLVAGMLGDWVIPFVYNIGIDGFRASVLGWIFLGGLVALEQITRQNTVTTKTN